MNDLHIANCAHVIEPTNIEAGAGSIQAEFYLLARCQTFRTGFRVFQTRITNKQSWYVFAKRRSADPSVGVIASMQIGASPHKSARAGPKKIAIFNGVARG